MLQPIGEMVIISRDNASKMSAGGVFLPKGAAQGILVWGMVVAAGPGASSDSGMLIPMTVEKGDEVLYDSRLAQEIERLPEWDNILNPDEKLFVIAESNIVARLPLR